MALDCKTETWERLNHSNSKMVAIIILNPAAPLHRRMNPADNSPSLRVELAEAESPNRPSIQSTKRESHL
jgi:hypothetical protein